MKIYLIRHGATDWNAMGILQGREDIPLNEKGIRQAEECGEKLRASGVSFEYIASSPLSRAYRTAEMIAGHMGIGKPIIEEKLTERDFGLLSGKNPGDVFDPSEEGNQMEPLDDTAERMIAGLMAVAEKTGGADFAAVSHGGSINAVLRLLSKGETGTGKIRLKNVCVNILDWDGEKFKIEGCNLDAGEL